MAEQMIPLLRHQQHDYGYPAYAYDWAGDDNEMDEDATGKQQWAAHGSQNVRLAMGSLCCRQQADAGFHQWLL
jgi:hypothetical protein